MNGETHTSMGWPQTHLGAGHRRRSEGQDTEDIPMSSTKKTLRELGKVILPETFHSKIITGAAGIEPDSKSSLPLGFA